MSPCDKGLYADYALFPLPMSSICAGRAFRSALSSMIGDENMVHIGNTGEGAVGVLEIQRAELDDAYLVDWAARLGIADELAWLMSAEAG